MSDMETAEAIYDNFGTEQSPLEDVVAIANAITAAREEGRAAGYAEAIEKAAKLCGDRSKAHQENVDRYEQLRDWDSMGHQNAAAIASNSLRNAIRALAPADKEKP